MDSERRDPLAARLVAQPGCAGAQGRQGEAVGASVTTSPGAASATAGTAWPSTQPLFKVTTSRVAVTACRVITRGGHRVMVLPCFGLSLILVLALFQALQSQALLLRRVFLAADRIDRLGQRGGLWLQ